MRFSKLIEDYPELPEPYNNLAALLRRRRASIDKARATLEMALRTNPSYATAHENLGDVYARWRGAVVCARAQLEPATRRSAEARADAASCSRASSRAPARRRRKPAAEVIAISDPGDSDKR